MSSPRRIDTHHHVVPPVYHDWLERKGVAAGGLLVPSWNEDEALAVMERLGVETAILSVSTPGVHLGDAAEARQMARTVNEYAANLVAKHPGRFGYFATLTLPDLEGSLAELEHAFDSLDADGVVLLANAGGIYLGDSRWDPLFDELNRRRATVFVHPSVLPGIEPLDGIPPFVVDFLLDTTRAAVQLCTSGTMQRCPDIKVILSHAGGFLPYAASRVITTTALPARAAGIDVAASLRRFYFDTALSSSHFALPTLLAFAEPGHVTFGTDWPYASERAAESYAGMYEKYALDDRTRASIDRGAAEALFPRLSKSP